MVKTLSASRNKIGFTLVELLIVIAIIGTLAGIGIGSYQESMRRARDGRLVANLEQIRSALEMCRADTRAYPNAVGANGSVVCTNGTTYFAGTSVGVYTYTGGGNIYELCTTLESPAGPFCVTNP